MPVQKIKSGRVNVLVDNFIGDNGVIFFDESQGDLRLGDGITPGGIPLTVGGGGGDGNYTLPTASTSVKGGVKVDGTTIGIANQIISVINGVFTSETYNNPSWINSLAYSKLTGTPTIPSNTNQLSNGAGFITSSALSGYATESYVTTRGYLTDVPEATGSVKGGIKIGRGLTKNLDGTVDAFSGSYLDLTNKPTIPTNTNQLTNGAGFITSSALSGYATETYVTTRGYLTSVSWNDVQSKPTFATVATSGSYADLTNKPIIPTDISQLSDSQGLLGQGGGGGGTTYVTNNVENPYTFSVAGDDSALIEISNGETLRFAGAGNISITTDIEGKVTITGPDLSSYATQSYVTSQGYITGAALTGLATESFVTSRGYLTSVSWNDLYDKPNLAGTYSFSVAADDSSLKEISAGESIKFIGSAGITTTSDAEGNITINGPDLSSYATQSYVGSQGFITTSALTGYATESYVTTRGYLTTVDWNIVQNKPNFFSGSYNDLTDRPNLAGTYSWSIAADDSSQIAITSGNLVKIVGDRGVTTTSNPDGQITITGPDLSSYATQSYVTSALNSAGVTVSETAPTGRTNGALWYSSVDLQMYVLYQNQWVAVSSGFSGNYNDLANKPSNVSQFSNDAGYTTRDEVYAMILELSS